MSIELFYCYAHEDKEWRKELDRHLSALKRLGMIKSWYDGEIVPGATWERAIIDHLDRANLVLLLISSYFLSSDYCYSTEMARVLDRHKADEAIVIPVLLRPVDWEGSPFSTLQMLPSDAKPITQWANQDEAFIDIAKGIRRVVSQLVVTQFTPKTETFNYTSIRSLPVVTDHKAIQQREGVVREIYAKLIESDSSSVVLTGIGGIGKSTLAALVFNYAESQRKATKGPFMVETVILRINATTTFTDLATNIFDILGKTVFDFSHLTSQNQAYNLFNTLNSVDKPRLIVLDQFENFLDERTGRTLMENSGIGEFLDILNSQSCTCRILLTSRPRPRGTRDEQPVYMRVYPVNGLDTTEGIDLLHNQGVEGSDTEVRIAVERCKGHGIALKLLITLLKDYSLSLSRLLNDPVYIELWERDIANSPKFLDYIYVKLLDDLARQLLQAFSIYREPVPIEAVHVVVGQVPEIEIRLAFRSLLAQNLCQAANEGLYELHPLVASYTKKHFVEKDEEANKRAMRGMYAQAARYYIQTATKQCPQHNKRQRIKDIQPLIEAVWQYCQAGLWQEAFELIDKENLFNDLRLWGENVVILEFCQILCSENWQYEPLQFASIYSSQASVYKVLGRRNDAILFFQKALLIARQESELNREGRTLNELGEVYYALGYIEEALKYYYNSLKVASEIADLGVESEVRNNLGRVYRATGQKEEAIKYYQEALKIKRSIKDRKGEGSVLNNIGMLYRNWGEDEEALQYYQEALYIRKEVNDCRGEGVTLNNIGAVYRTLGRNEDALQYLRDALHIKDKVGDVEGKGMTLWNIGILYYRLNRYDVSLAALLLAKDFLEEVQSPNVGNEKALIDILCREIGKQTFDQLLAQVEAQAAKIVELALQEIL